MTRDGRLGLGQVPLPKGAPMFRNAIRSRRALVAVVAAALAVGAVSVVAAYSASGNTETSFQLAPNPKFVNCLAKYPNDPSRPPTASVDVEKGDLNDTLKLHLRNIKPNLA